MVATAIIALVIALVYASLFAVTDATDLARESAMEMRRRQFLSRSFLTNFSSVFTDEALMDERFAFIGVSESGSGGDMDAVEFCAATPLMGGASPPGAIKRVFYGAVSTNDPGMGLSSFEDEPGDASDAPSSDMMLQSSESPVVEPFSDEDLGGFGAVPTADLDDDAADSAAVSWTEPVGSFDVAYFDGQEWVEEWDSLNLGRLPWCVRIRINFVRTEEEAEADAEARLSSEEDPDYELIVPIPTGVGVTSRAEEWFGEEQLTEQTRPNEGATKG